jgi:hypothetical protein
VRTYQVRVQRYRRYWSIHVPELDRGVQARHLHEIESLARNLIATAKNIDADSVDVDVQIELPPETQARLDRAEELLYEAAKVNNAAAEEVRVAVRELQDRGYPPNAIGAALETSHPRAHQLVS